MTDNKITLLAKVYNGVRGEIDVSALGEKEANMARDICLHLEELRRFGDFGAMLEAEESLIALDAEKAIAREPHITGQMQRMERAARQAAQAQKCHEQLTQNTDAYKNSREYYSALDRNGYPKDSCREFLGSQSTRVNDSLRESHNDAAASIFKARNTNIELMKSLYPAIQASLIKKQERGPESMREAHAESKRIQSTQQERKFAKDRSKDEDQGR